MNPFPDFIISPTTANRIPRTPGAEGLIHRIFLHEVNAAAFLMDEDLLADLEAKGFRNDLDRAIMDLIQQLPRHIQDAVFPPPPQNPESEDDSSDEGKDSPPPVKGFSLKISDGYSIAVSPDPPQISSVAPPPKKLKPLSKAFFPTRFKDPQDPKKKRSGLSLGM